MQIHTLVPHPAGVRDISIRPYNHSKSILWSSILLSLLSGGVLTRRAISRFCFCFASGPELLGEYNSTDCAIACDEPYQDLGCGGINPDNLVQLYSYYTQDGAIVSNGTSLTNSTATRVSSSDTSMSTVFTVSSLAVSGIGATATELSPAESSGAYQPTGASIPGQPPPAAPNSGMSVGSAGFYNHTTVSSLLSPTAGIPTGGAPLTLTTGLAGSGPSEPATIPTAPGTGTNAPSSVGQGSSGGRVETTAPPVVTTTAGAPPAAAAATTIAVEYGQDFWVSVASLVQSVGDVFENYTLSSASGAGAGAGAEDADDVTIWWDRLDLEFGGVIVAGPRAPRPAAWLIHVTMRRAGGGDAYYSFVIEVDVAGTYGDGAGTGVPSGVVTLPQAMSPTRAAVSSQAPSWAASLSEGKPPAEETFPSQAASSPRSAPPTETAPATETSQTAYPIQTSRSADSGAFATPTFAWNNSSTSASSGIMLVSSTLSSTAFASSSATPNSPYQVVPGRNFTINLSDVSGNPNDKFVSFTASTLPAGYDTSWIMYDEVANTFYGQVPDGFPSVRILLRIVVQRTTVGKRQEETAYSVEFGLSVKASPDNVVYASPASPDPALASNGALVSPENPIATPLSFVPTAVDAGSEVVDQTASKSTSAGLADLQAVHNAVAAPDSSSEAELSPDALQTATPPSNIDTSWTTGTDAGKDGVVATPAVPAFGAGFLEVYAPAGESTTSEDVAKEDGTGTASVPATAPSSGGATSSPVATTEVTASPMTTVVVTTCETDLDDPLVTAGLTSSATNTVSGTVGVAAGGQNTSASVSLLPVTAGAVARDGLVQLEGIAFMVLGIALGALLLA